MLFLGRSKRRGGKKKRSLAGASSFLFLCSIFCLAVGHWIQEVTHDASEISGAGISKLTLSAKKATPTQQQQQRRRRASSLSARHLVEEEEAGSAAEVAEEEPEEKEESGEKSHHGKEEEGEEGEEEEEEEEEDETAFEEVDLEVVVVIALFLILATLAFEYMKDSLEESVTEDLEIILEKLFGELTILGFLAIVTFVLTQTGVLQMISIKVFGEEEELLEYFEAVHYSIFFIMVFFVIQVLILINEASETERQWEQMDMSAKMASASSRTSFSQSSRQALVQKENIWTTCFPQLRDPKKELKRMHLIFKALREEFILERSLEPGFTPAPDFQRVEKDFNFGRYLSLAQAVTLTKIVEVEERTWFLFAVATGVFFGICQLVGRDIEIISWIWVGIGYIMLFGNIMFERHLVAIRNKFLPKRLLAYSSSDVTRTSAIEAALRAPSGTSDENTYLIDTFYGGTNGDEDLPAWCDIDIDNYRANRNWFTKCVVGGKPNRQQALFLMDQFGPSLYFILLQANLVYVGVYAGLLLLSFYPFIIETYHWTFSTLFVALSILPVVGVSYNKKRVVSALAQVVSVGTYRKPQIVSDVLLETKTGRVVRTFLIIHKMWHTAKYNLDDPPASEKPAMKRGESFSALEEKEVSKSFDALDADGSGAISHDEFRDLLTRLGAELSDEAFQRMVNALDADGDGEVTKEEFLDWYAAHSAADAMSLEERAKDLFEMFDDDHSGELSIGELKSKIDALGMGFSVDEIGAIVNELDRDRSGTVSEEEFYSLLEKYYPKELEDEYAEHAEH